MKRPDLDPRSVLYTLGALAVAGAIGGGAVVGLGLYNTSAMAGHWAGVPWVLHTTFRNSVDLRATPESEVPDLTDEMVELGARHFEAACTDCHAAPGRGRTATMKAMVPQPPHITEAVQHWSPGELHWILYAGVKMSGMPAWPADRKDEVWPVVAFLDRVQQGMTGQQYQRLVNMPPDGTGGLAYCISCHGAKGGTDNPRIPRLDIQSQSYMTLALQAYRRGERDSGIMEHAATEVPEAELARFASIFADMPPAAAGEPAPLSALARAGRDLAAREDDRRVPSCNACHGPWPEPLDDKFPSLAGQNETYLAMQLRLWRDGERGGSSVSELMHAAAEPLTDDDISALAAYYAALPPAKLNDTADPE